MAGRDPSLCLRCYGMAVACRATDPCTVWVKATQACPEPCRRDDICKFISSKYCADLFDDETVREGLSFVREEVAAYIPRGDETEVIKAAIRERPPRRLIDQVQVELDERLQEGVYWAHLLTANIRQVNISPRLVEQYQRLLTAGVWCNLLVNYDDSIRYRGRTFPFVIHRLEPVQVGSVNMEEYCAGRRQFTRDQWVDALVRTMGVERFRKQHGRNTGHTVRCPANFAYWNGLYMGASQAGHP